MTAMTTPAADGDPSPATAGDVFMSVMPAIAARAHRRFAYLPAADREDAVAESIAAGYVMACSLVRRGRGEHAKTVSFTANAVRAAAGGRRVGSSQAARDVLSPLGRRRHGQGVVSLDADGDPDEDGRNWRHEALADRDAEEPGEVVRREHGYPLMLDGVSDKAMATFRFIAETHGAGRQADLAADLMVSPARITQLKRELADVMTTHGYTGPLARRPARRG